MPSNAYVERRTSNESMRDAHALSSLLRSFFRLAIIGGLGADAIHWCPHERHRSSTVIRSFVGITRCGKPVAALHLGQAVGNCQSVTFIGASYRSSSNLKSLTGFQRLN